MAAEERHTSRQRRCRGRTSTVTGNDTPAVTAQVDRFGVKSDRALCKGIGRAIGWLGGGGHQGPIGVDFDPALQPSRRLPAPGDLQQSRRKISAPFVGSVSVTVGRHAEEIVARIETEKLHSIPADAHRTDLLAPERFLCYLHRGGSPPEKR